jgi:hypothetical protein
MLAPQLRVKDYARKTLRPRHKAVVARLAEGYFAYRGPMDPALLVSFTEEVDRAISNASKTLRFGLLVMLDALRWLPLFLLGKPAAFEDLGLEDRQRMLERMERSNFVALTLIFVAYKTLMTMMFFEQPNELIAIGYPGPERHRYLDLGKGRTAAPLDRTPEVTAERTK